MNDLSFQAAAIHFCDGLSADASSLPELVKNPLSYSESLTTSPSPSLIDTVMEDLKRELTRRDLAPTTQQLTALQALLSTLSALAQGRCSPELVVCDLAPGMGKTTALALFLRHLARAADHDEVGVLVCLPFLDEIERLVTETGLGEGEIAVMWSDPDRALPTSTPPDQAQILIITPQMLMRRCGTGLLAECRDFHFLGQPRQLRVWDETMDPAQVVTLSTDDLGGLLAPIRSLNTDLADTLAKIQLQLATAKPHQLVQLPEIPASLRVSVSQVDDGVQDPLARLYALSGKVVKICNGSGKLRMALDIRDSLPADFAPALVLDASASVRGTWALWRQQPGGPRLLPGARKDYGALTIHLMERGAGKQSWQKDGERLAREVAAVIDSKPDQRFLVVHHLAPGGVQPVKLIKRFITTDPSRVSFLHWGRHMATNAFRDVENVILAGVMRLPESQHIGLAHASLGLPITAELPADAVAQIEVGEFAHAVLQAAGRGRVRGCKEGRCPSCDLYIIAPGKKTKALLQATFPGARVKPWKQQNKPLKGRQQKELIALIDASRHQDPTAPIFFADLMAGLGIADRANFNRLCRHPDVAAELARRNLQRVQIHASRGADAFQPMFGPVVPPGG
ncbi:hypothetical protein [Rhodobacter sp. TJ_12]|uniref:hypothetical protein n=1 Tax=Rhodobacter sp. TJ_12 TaxID=2029399 RepID=UPI001CBBD1C7|nr:hypothetical protein [Rhodobacter sp. TJ_12]